MGRPTRNKRRQARRAPRGKGKGKDKSFLCVQCSSYYDVMEQSTDLVQIFIANRGRGKGKGKGSNGVNPIDPQGNIMKCHNCGSTSHLINRCPQPKRGGTMSVFSVEEITDDGVGMEITEDGSSQPASVTPEEVQLSFCFLIGGYGDGRTTELDPRQCRPRCQCTCGCIRRPGAGYRRLCSGCNALVGPGCCWIPDTQLCHICDARVEPDPEPSDVALAWSFPAFDATNDQSLIQIYLGDSNLGPCLLVDTGAFQNIAGSYWVSRVEEILKQEGQPPI